IAERALSRARLPQRAARDGERRRRAALEARRTNATDPRLDAEHRGAETEGEPEFRNDGAARIAAAARTADSSPRTVGRRRDRLQPDDGARAGNGASNADPAADADAHAADAARAADATHPADAADGPDPIRAGDRSRIADAAARTARAAEVEPRQ